MKNSKDQINTQNLEENKNLTELKEFIPHYAHALKVLDKEYHQFEHNFSFNLNRYPQNLLNEKTALDNSPELAHSKDRETFNAPVKQKDNEGIENCSAEDDLIEKKIV